MRSKHESQNIFLGSVVISAWCVSFLDCKEVEMCLTVKKTEQLLAEGFVSSISVQKSPECVSGE